jgi:hypothetical protein
MVRPVRERVVTERLGRCLWPGRTPRLNALDASAGADELLHLRLGPDCQELMTDPFSTSAQASTLEFVTLEELQADAVT